MNETMIPASPRDLVRAYAARAELAAVLGEPKVREAMRAAFRQLKLTPADRAELRSELEELA